MRRETEKGSKGRSCAALALFAVALSSPPRPMPNARRQDRVRYLVVSAAAAIPGADEGSSITFEEDFAIAAALDRSGTGSSSVSSSWKEKATKEEPLLTVQLSSSAHPRGLSEGTGENAREEETNAPHIPLVGIGVGNLPHAKIPYILAAALTSTKNTKNSQQQQPVTRDNNNGDVGNNYRLIDTSHTDSALEVLVGRSLGRLLLEPSATTTTSSAAAAASAIRNDGRNNVYHVMIKIRHTHLGYERTVRSVQDSLSDILPGLSSGTKKKSAPNKSKGPAVAAGEAAATPDVRVHAILQYPRCYDGLFSSFAKYASCQEEEAALVPSPLHDKENAWKRSYRALEEMYHHGTLESIGVSNFGPQELLELFEIATVGPHVYQGSIGTLLTMDGLVEMLVRHGVHYQCYDAVSTILKKKVRGGEEQGSIAPRAFAKLERIGAAARSGDEVYGYSPIQVVLGWLVRNKGVGVVPGTTNTQHLAENSPLSLGSMPKFGPREALDIENAVAALVTGVDIADTGVGPAEKHDAAAAEAAGATDRPPRAGRRPGNDGDDASGARNVEPGEAGAGVVATFFNALPRKNVRIFRVHPDTGEQIQISHNIPPGRSGRMIVNQQDVLIAYDRYGAAVKKFLVEEDEKNRGSVDFLVES